MPGSHTEMYIGFNPRSHEGSDRITDAYQGFSKQFQSTLPRRERLLSLRCWEKIREFQSTLPRRERRLWSPCFLVVFVVSIHAPTKGATSYMTKSEKTVEFQSTLPRRERRQASGGNVVDLSFNPRSHEGSDGFCRMRMLCQ